MILYRLAGNSIAISQYGALTLCQIQPGWDALFNSDNPRAEAEKCLAAGSPLGSLPSADLLPPIGSQEVWAAGVTYFRSRTARMEESKEAGGGDFYDRVYHAHRPELFFKATPHRVVGHLQPMRLRPDSSWMVPEPEATLAFNSRGQLVGLTIGNDLSSRDIEGENPLYLPQAKVFDSCAALGPGLLLTTEYPSPDTPIQIEIVRAGQPVFSGATSLAEMKQPLENLREHLFRHNSFPAGCFLMTGTGTVPPDNFTLQPGDSTHITIPQVGTLSNLIS